jgi:hypothetical protein
MVSALVVVAAAAPGPQVARFTGVGSMNDAASRACVAPTRQGSSSAAGGGPERATAARSAAQRGSGRPRRMRLASTSVPGVPERTTSPVAA